MQNGRLRLHTTSTSRRLWPKKVKDAKRISELLPPGVAKVKENKLIIDEKALIQTDLAGVLDEVMDEVSLEERPDTLIFTVESWGQLSPKEILTQAAEEFSAELQQLSDKL